MAAVHVGLRELRSTITAGTWGILASAGRSRTCSRCWPGDWKGAGPVRALALALVAALGIVRLRLAGPLHPQRCRLRPLLPTTRAAIKSAAALAAAAKAAPSGTTAQGTDAEVVPLTPADAPSMYSYDPWERMNRFTYRFNARFDEDHISARGGRLSAACLRRSAPACITSSESGRSEDHYQLRRAAAACRWRAQSREVS